MKQYTVYVCETCSYKSRDAKEMKEHEAEHLGLTVEEMDKYMDLKACAEFMGRVMSKTRNEDTIKKFNDAVQRLIDFGKEHGIKNK